VFELRDPGLWHKQVEPRVRDIPQSFPLQAHLLHCYSIEELKVGDLITVDELRHVANLP